MNTKTIITNTLGFVLLLSVSACQQEKTKSGGGAASSPTAQRPTDVDLSYGYVRKDGAIHFIGGSTTGTGADATRIDTPSRKVIKGFKDKDSVHYQHEQIAGADPASFRHLGSGYYADRNRAYWCTKPIPGADQATFEVLGDSFIAKDKSRVYRSGELMRGIDAASLRLILHDPMGFQIYSDKNGIHVNKMTFPRFNPGRVEVIDNLTVKADDLVFLVETSRFKPVTVFKEDGKLMAETPAYDSTSGMLLGTITAEVTAGELKDIRTRPLPGRSEAPSVPDWQLDVLRNPDLVQRMIEAGKRIK